jgi:hypothetical protein
MINIYYIQNSMCYTPSSEPYRIYIYYTLQKTQTLPEEVGAGKDKTYILTQMYFNGNDETVTILECSNMETNAV